MRVVWSEEAAQCLRAITRYIAQDSPTAARKVAARLLLRSRQLAEPPLLGRPMREYPDTGLRELLERPYRLIYRVHDTHIEIVTVKHYRQRLPDDAANLHGG